MKTDEKGNKVVLTAIITAEKQKIPDLYVGGHGDKKMLMPKAVKPEENL